MKYYNLVIKGSCPYCTSAIAFLADREEQFVYTDTENCGFVLDFVKKQSGHETVPMIWEITVDQGTAITRFIGGYDDLKQDFGSGE